VVFFKVLTRLDNTLISSNLATIIVNHRHSYLSSVFGLFLIFFFKPYELDIKLIELDIKMEKKRGVASLTGETTPRSQNLGGFKVSSMVYYPVFQEGVNFKHFSVNEVGVGREYLWSSIYASHRCPQEPGTSGASAPTQEVADQR